MHIVDHNTYMFNFGFIYVNKIALLPFLEEILSFCISKKAIF